MQPAPRRSTTSSPTPSGPRRDEVRVDAALADRARHVVLSVVDDGDGVADRDGAALFGSGLFVEQDTERERLPTRRSWASASRARSSRPTAAAIHVESTLGVGTTVRVDAALADSLSFRHCFAK